MPGIFSVFLVVAVVVLIVMIGLANYRASQPLAQADVTSAGYRLRRYWFWAILIGSVATFAITIPRFPYSQAHELPAARHLSVLAQQYGFQIGGPLTANTDFIFDVTSKDVNHGFGIYAPDGRLVSQVQAMPGYVNHLHVRFAQRGHYLIRCLEYCGIAHAAMQGGFDVR